MRRVAIIGAGSSGLPAIKCCLDENLEPVCFERDDDIGGLWYYKKNAEDGVSSVMKSTVINTSKELMAYSDFPVPKEFPMFMHHSKVLEYYKLYAQHFNLYNYIKFQMEVIKVKQTADFARTGRWEIETRNRKTNVTRKEIFDAVMLCTGHHADKSMPYFEGEEDFQGLKMHSHEYRDGANFQEKRVVVIGLGNSGGDIAVELSKFGNQVYLSTRRGCWMAPRVVEGGVPFDDALNTRLINDICKICPRYLVNWYFENYLNKLINHDMYGLKPQHSFDAEQILINDELPNRLASGTVIIKPNVKCITKTNVEFEDGTTVKNIDVIIYATGYTFSFKFMEHEGLKVKDEYAMFYKRVFPPDIQPATLAVIGCFQPLGAVMPLCELQCRWALKIFKKERKLPSVEEMYSDIEKKRQILAKRYIPSLRYTMQEDYIPFMDELAELCGCKYSWVDLLLRDPPLAMKLYFGPVTPFQNRLVGHGAWRGAREAIMTSQARLLFPLSRPKPNGSKRLNYKGLLLKLLAVGCVLFVLVLNVLVFQRNEDVAI